MSCQYLLDSDIYVVNKIDSYVDKELSYMSYRNAYILPNITMKEKTAGGIVTEGMEYVENSALINGHGCSYDFRHYRTTKKKAIYLGVFINVWGHFITDCISRLWFLSSHFLRNIWTMTWCMYHVLGLNGKRIINLC